jgi:hypothetical protein
VGSKTKVALAAMLIGCITLVTGCPGSGAKTDGKGSTGAGQKEDGDKGATKGQDGAAGQKVSKD